MPSLGHAHIVKDLNPDGQVVRGRKRRRNTNEQNTSVTKSQGIRFPISPIPKRLRPELLHRRHRGNEGGGGDGDEGGDGDDDECDGEEERAERMRTTG